MTGRPRTRGVASRTAREAVALIRRARYLLLAAAALVVTVLGWRGWLESDPSLSSSDALYWSVALFTLNAPGNPPSTSLTLEFARWGALVVAATTLTSLASAARRSLSEFDVRQRVRAARRLTSHKVVIGDGPEVARLAASYRAVSSPPAVVAIGVVAAGDRPELVRAGVVLLDGVDDADLEPILRDASRVVVVGRTDAGTLAMAARVERLEGDLPHVSVLVDDRDLAAQWNRSKSSRAVSRPVRVATELLRHYPPLPERLVVPSPIVIGEGALAVEIARRIVVGWQEPGEQLTVHLVGLAGTAADSVRWGLEARGDFHVWQAVTHPDEAAARAREIVAGHRYSNFDPDRMTLAGPRVYVASADDARTVTIAAAVAAAIPNAAVIGVVADGGAWTEDLIHDTGGRLVSSDRLLTDHSSIEKSSVDLVRDEIQADVRRSGGASILRTALAVGEEAQARIARHLPALLGAAGLDLDARIWPSRTAPILGPTELRALAEALEAIVGPEVFPTRRAALAFAARLPTLASRAGHTPDWSAGHDPVIAASDIDLLGRAAHQAYLEAAARTANATGSENAERPWEELSALDVRSNYAQVADIPLKLALAGFDWVRASPDERSVGAFADDEVELLAEAEHERWCEFSIRHGRPGSQWVTPWERLTDAEREYDRAPVRVIPAALGTLGIQVRRRPDSPGAEVTPGAHPQ